jgi:hypothetical protein
MREADLTPMPTAAIAESAVDGQVATPPRDATRLTHAVGEESRATAIIAARAEADPFEEALALSRAAEDAGRDGAVIAAVMARIPGRASTEPFADAAAMSLVAAASLATAAACTLIGGGFALDSLVAAAGILAAIVAAPRSLRATRPADAPAAAGCIALLMLALGLADGETRFAIAAGLGFLGSLAFVWSWTRSAAGRQLQPFARVVGGAFFLVCHHTIG